MANLALIYPEISSEDFAKIQSMREKHDLKYFNVVAPHITLVFGTDKISPDELSEHVRNKLGNSNVFDLKFESARVVEDDTNEFFHTFLIPSAGSDEINTIHDILYTDVLASELRHDIPFIPHLGIGTGTENEMISLAEELNKSHVSINGTAREVAIVQYDGNKVTDYSVLPLV